MEGESQVELHVIAKGRNRSGPVTAKLGEKVLHVDTGDITKDGFRASFLSKLCEVCPGVNRADAEAKLLALAGEVATKQDQQQEQVEADATALDSQELLAAMPEEIRQEAQAMLREHDLFKHVLDDIEALGVAGERELTGSVYLVGTSRLLESPLAAIVQGLSSSGKSYSVAKTAMLFPPEAVIHATQMTPQALFHMEPGSLAHRFIVAGERSRIKGDEAAEATRALREMLSAGKLSKLMPVKEDGQIVTKRIEQDGPIAYVESTTMHKIDDEDANRCLLLHTDEQASQTKRIVEHLAVRYSGGVNVADQDRIVQRHHALQRMLLVKDVVVPFARRLGDLFPMERVEARRAFPQVMSMIQAITLLYQFQRKTDEQGRLVATAEDYQLARHLLSKPMGRLLGGLLPDSARRFGARLRAWTIDTFTTTDVIQKEKVSDRAVRGWLSDLHEAGVLELVEPSRGSRPAQWRRGKVSLEDIEQDCPDLPTMEIVFPEMACRHSDNPQVQVEASVMPEAAGIADNFRQDA